MTKKNRPSSKTSKPKPMATKPKMVKVDAAKDIEDVLVPLEAAVNAPTTFLLRLPGDMRMALEELKDESNSKSLNGLVLQLLAEGLGRKSEFEKSELFARDLHVATLALAVGPTPDLVINGIRLELDGTKERRFEVDQASLLNVHHRVVQDLENQKLTSFASIMDPALLAYRLLIEFSLQPDKRDNAAIVRDFSNGLKDSALLAMQNRKWAFAEHLLLQAAAVDPTNVTVGYETGIYMLRRLVRRWRRPSDSLTPRITNGNFNWTDYEWQQRHADSSGPQKVKPEDEEMDATVWAVASRAWELLNDTANHFTTPPLVSWHERWNDRNVSEKVDIWKRLGAIIVCTSSPEPDDLKLLINSKSRCFENMLLEDLVTLFNKWASDFRMTREVSRLQEKWADWLEPLEVLWGLGYRKEAYGLAMEARGFVADKPVAERMALIRAWNPEMEQTERLGEDDSGFDYQVIWTVDIEQNMDYAQEPLALFNRPMNV